jgi:tetratricopeptide (TPR) repeat protein
MLTSIIEREAQKAVEKDHLCSLLNRSIETLHSNPEDALAFADEALRLCDLTVPSWEHAEAVRLIGDSKYMLGKYDESMAQANLCLAEFAGLHDMVGEGKAHFLIALNHFEFGNYVLVEDELADAERLYKTGGYERGIVDCVNLRGSVRTNMSDYVSAIESRLWTLEESRRLGYKSGEQRALNNLGFVYHLSGNNTRALEVLHEGLEFARELGNPSTVALALSNIGGIYEHLGDFERSQEYLESSLEIAREIGNKRIECLSLLNLSMLAFKLERIAEARELCVQSLGLARASKHVSNCAEALQHLAKIDIRTGRVDEALEELEESLALSRKMASPRMVYDLLLTIATAHEQAGHTAEALRFYKEHLAAHNDAIVKQRQEEVSKLMAKFELEKR